MVLCRCILALFLFPVAITVRFLHAFYAFDELKQDLQEFQKEEQQGQDDLFQGDVVRFSN